MRSKKLLAAFLLGVGLCFVPVLGHGYISKLDLDMKASKMDVGLLDARVDYIMKNSINFLDVHLFYDPVGFGTDIFPYGVETKGRIIILVYDNRGIFSDRSGAALLNQFKKELEAIYKSLRIIASDMDTDIVASFRIREDVSLGYFYQGEYHLWEK